MRVRDARPEDLGRLLELYSLLEGPYTEGKALAGPEAENLFTRILLDPNQQTLVAEDYGEIVGTLVVAILPNLAHGGEPYAVVENVAVDEEHRGESVGSALMREGVARARKAGAYKLALCSNLEREESHSFYRSIGMQQTHAGFEVTP
jgi:ribosomal protein S18 acetylase RimI-like enzyme